MSTEQIIGALRAVKVPGLDGNLVEGRMIAGLNVSEGDDICVALAHVGSAEQRQAIEGAVSSALRPLAGTGSIEVHFKREVAARPIGQDDPVPGARNIILVMSGKGGVGKSTVSTNLALALSRMGNRVGLLDADLYGPSIPTMLGINSRPQANAKRIQPLTRFGLKLMSIGFLLDEPNAAVVWRGPMLHSALMQFLGDVAWGDLDYLVLDLPPGTGDIALTLSQKLRCTGAIIVTTPQEVALQDVYKSVSMAKKVGIEILGVVENESYFVCGKCDERHEIFGSGGGAKAAEAASAPLLGSIPLDPAVRGAGDSGVPIVQAMPASATAQAFVSVAESLLSQIDRAAGTGPQVSIDRSGGSNRHLPVTR